MCCVVKKVVAHMYTLVLVVIDVSVCHVGVLCYRPDKLCVSGCKTMRWTYLCYNGIYI